MENEINIALPCVEDKILFLEWFNRRGFNQFLEFAGNETSIECIATLEPGTTPDSEEEIIENGYIELQ